MIMKTVLTIFSLFLLLSVLSSCTHERSYLKVNDALSWLVGDENDDVTQSLTLDTATEIEVSIAQESLCQGAFWVAIEIRQGEELLLSDTARTLPYLQSTAVAADTPVAVRTYIVEGEELIQCVWLGNALCRVNY